MAGDITRRATIQFGADTSAAQAQIQALAQSLQQAFNASGNTTGVASIDKQLQQANIAAAKLQTTLQAAFNTNTGKLDLTKFNDSLKSSSMSLEQYKASLSTLGSTGNAAFINLARSITTAEVPLRRTNGLIQQLGVSLKNTIKWNISASMVNAFVGGLQSAFNYAEKLNSSLNRIQIVTGESAAQMAKFAEQANKSAQSLSTTTRAYTDAALIFYQQGLKDADVKLRTDAVIKMANVTGDAAKEVSNYMTAIWNNFDTGTSSLESFEDKIVSLGATTASSSAEIAAGLEKFASIGQTIGLSFDYAAAALSTVVAETRQSADTVGTAFRTLFSRLQGLKLGETLDDGTTLNKYSTALATVGVQIKDASGQLKSMDTILNELATNWGKMSKAQQVALAQTVGGARQYTTLIALMENWDQFQKNLMTEANSTGALQKQADIYAESWQAAKDKVTASLEGIYQSLIDDKFFINLNQNIATALTGINNFIKNIGGVKTVLGDLGAIALNVFDKQIAQSIDRTINNFKMFTGIGQQEMTALKSQAADLLGSMGGSTTGGIGATSMDTAYKNEAAAQLLLIKQSAQLGEQEQKVANILLQQVQARTDAQAKIAESVDQTETSLDKLESKMKGLADVRLDASGATGFISDLKEIRGLATDVEQVDSLTQKLQSLFNSPMDGSAEAISNKLKDIQSVIRDFDFSNLSTNGVVAFELLKKAIDKAVSERNFVDAQQAFEEFSKLGQSSIDAVTAKIEDYKDKLAKLQEFQAQTEASGGSIAGTAVEQRMLFLQSIIPQLETYIELCYKSGGAIRDLGSAEHDTAQATNSLEAYLKSASIHISSTGEMITTYARSISTVVNGFRTLSNAVKTFNDNSKPLSERLTTLVGSIAMFVPMVVSSATAFIKMGAGMRKAAIEASAMSAVDKELALSNITLGQSFAAAMGPLIALTVAIGAAVLIYEKFIKNAEHTESFVDKYKSAQEQIKSTAEELTNVANKASEVRSLFDQYGSVVEALNNCKKGSQEWAEELQNVYNIQKQILEENPEILDFMTNIAPNITSFDTNAYIQDGVIQWDLVLSDWSEYLAYKTLGEGLSLNSMQQRGKATALTGNGVAGVESLMADIVQEGSIGRQFSLSNGPQVWVTQSDEMRGWLYDEETQKVRMLADNVDELVKPILEDIAEVTGNPNLATARNGASIMAKGRIDPTEMLEGFWQAAVKYGLENSIPTLESAGEQYIASFGEENAQAFKDMWQATFGISRDLFALGQTKTPWETLGQLGEHGNYRASLATSYDYGYQASQATPLSDTVSAVNLISQMIPESIRTQYTTEEQNLLYSTSGAEIALQILNDSVSDLEGNALAAASAIVTENDEIASFNAVMDETTGELKMLEFYGSKEDGAKLIQSLTPIEALLQSDQGINYLMGNQFLEKLPKLVLDTIPAPLQQWITDGGTFANYTAKDMAQLGTLNQEGMWSEQLEEMFASVFDSYSGITKPEGQTYLDYFTSLVPNERGIIEGSARIAGQEHTAENHPAGVYYDQKNKLWRSTGYELMTQQQQFDYHALVNNNSLFRESYPNAPAYNPELHDYISQILPYITSSDQLNELFNFDFGRGTASVNEFLGILQDWGMELEEDNELYQGLINTVEQSTPFLNSNTKAFANLTDSNKDYAKQLKAIATLNAKGTITQDDYNKLSEAGFDLSGVSAYGEGYRGKVDLTRALKDFQAAKDLQLFSTDYYGHQRIRGGTGFEEQIAALLGFENYDDYNQRAQLASYATKNEETGEWQYSNAYKEKYGDYDLWGSLESQIATFDRTQLEGLEGFDANGLFYLLAQYGTMYYDAMMEYDEELTQKYLSLMLEKQAELDGITLTDQEKLSLPTMSKTDYETWSSDKKRRSGISNLTAISTSDLTTIQSTLNKNGVGVTTSEQTQLDNLRQNIANMFGMNLSDVTAEWLQEYWTDIEGLMSGDITKTLSSLKHLNQSEKVQSHKPIPENELNNWAQAFVQGHQDTYQTQLKNAISKNLQKEAQRDTQRTNQAQAGQTLSSSLAGAAQSGVWTASMRGQLNTYGMYGGDTASIVDAWNKATDAAERYAVAADLAKKSYGEQADVIQENITGAKQARDYLLSTQADYLTNFSGNIDEINNNVTGIIASVSKTMPDAANIMQQAWSNVKLTGTESAAQVRAAWLMQIQALADESEISLTELASNFGIQMSEIISAQLASEQSAAQSVADAWANAFQVIATAREGLSSGKSLSEILAGDTDSTLTIMSVIETALRQAEAINDNMSREEINALVQKVYNGGTVYGNYQGSQRTAVTRESALKYSSINVQDNLKARGAGMFMDESGAFYQDFQAARQAYMQTNPAVTITQANAALKQQMSEVATSIGLAADADWDTIVSKLGLLSLAIEQSAKDLQLADRIAEERATRDLQTSDIDKEITKKQAMVDVAQKMFDNRDAIVQGTYGLADALSGSSITEADLQEWLGSDLSDIDWQSAVENGLADINQLYTDKAAITAGYVQLFATGNEFAGATAGAREASETHLATVEAGNQAANTARATKIANDTSHEGDEIRKVQALAELYGKDTWTDADILQAQTQYGVTGTTLSERQASIREIINNANVGNKYQTDKANAIAGMDETDFKRLTSNIQTAKSEIDAMQSSLDNFNLDNFAANSADSWETLSKRIGLTKKEFMALSKEEQRSKLGQAQRDNLQESLKQQQALIAAYHTEYDDKWAEDESNWTQATRDAHAAYVSALQAEVDLRNQIHTSQVNEDNDLINIRAANLDAKIAALQAENEAEQKIIDNYKAASDTIINSINEGILTATQKLAVVTALGEDAGQKFLQNWTQAGNAAERAQLAAQLTASYTEKTLQQQASVQAGITGAQGFLNGFNIGQNGLGTDAGTFRKNTIFGGTDSSRLKSYLDQHNIDAQIANQLLTADAKVRPTLGDNASTSEYFTAMRAELQSMGVDAQTTFDQIAASGKDSLTGIFSGLEEEARSAAQAATEAWLSAFEAIAEARATLISGGNLLDTLAGDPTKLLTLARGTATNGDIASQMQRIVQGTTSGTLTANDLNSNLSWQDYRNSQLNQYHLNATAEGWAANFAQGNATVYGDRQRLANELGLNANDAEQRATLDSQLIDSYSQILQANGMEVTAAKNLARKAVETGEGYDEIKTAAGDLSTAIDYATGLYQFQQKAKEDSAAIQAAGDVSKMSYGGRTNEQWTKLQDAITKGQTAAKSATDQSSWEQQMLASGYGDALALLQEAGIGFGNVNTAAESCASALAALAAAAQSAAQAEAKNRGYTQNAQGKWQKDYTGGVTQSELENEYGDSWQSVANTLTAVTDDAGNIIKYTGVYVDEGLTSALQTIITQSQQAQASLEQIQLQKLSDAAAALGTDVGGLESYIQSIALAEGTLQSMTDTWGKWEDMALSTQTMLAAAAIEYNKSIAAIEKISEADALFKAIDKEAGTDATALKEKAAAYRELADAVNNYFLDGLADPQFVQDNLQLIKDWANGSIEAMEQLEAKLLAVFNEQYELNISSDSLAELNNWANGLQFGEALTQEQLDWINNFQKINNLTDEQLAKMADLCGVTLEFNHESVEIPRNTKAANEQLAKMVKNAQAIDKSTREGAEKYAQQVAAIQNANEALKKVKKSVEAAGQAGEKSYKDLAKQGANLAALAVAPAESFIGYKGILDANTAKTAAWNDALQNVSQSGTSLTDALNQANKSLEAMGEKPINVPVEVDTSKADADLAQVTDLEGLIHYLEEHEDVDPAVLEQEGVITYSYTGDAPSYHTEEETAANNTSFSGGGEVSALGLTVPYHFTYKADGDTTAAVPVLDGASGGSGNRGGGGGGGRRGGRGGGGGGGGGRRQDYTGDKKRKEQRYVTNTNQLEDLQHILEKINKSEERTYGRNRLKQMQAKAKALEDVAKKQKDLYDEAVKYAAQDKKDLQENDLAKKMGLEFEFDENGTILNRDEIEQKMLDYYNSFTNGRNEKGEYILKDNTEEGEAKFKMMQEDYADLEELLDKYDESQDKVKEYWESYMDSINEAYDTIVEMANYKVEVQVEVSDEALKLIDFMLGTIEDDAYKAADAIALMGKKALEYVNQDKINEAGIRDLFNHHDGQSKYFDEEGNEHTTTDLRGIVDGLLNGDQSAWDELMTHEEEFTQDELDSIQKMIDAKLEATQQLLAAQKEVYAQIGAVFDKGNEDMDRMINKIDHLSSITQHYNNIVDLVGHKKLGLTNDMLNEMDQSAVNQKLSKLRAVNSKYTTQQAEMSTLDSAFHDGKNWGTEQQREAALKKSGESLDKKSELEKQSIAKQEEREIAKDAKALTKERISDIKESIKDQKEIEKAATAAEKEAEGLAKNTQDELTKQQQAFDKLRVNRKGGGGRATSEDLVASAQSFSAEVSTSLDKMSASTKKGKKGQSLQKIGDVTNGLVAQAETAKLMEETASIEKAGAQAKLKALDSELIKEQDLLEIQSTKLDGLDKEIQALDKEAATQGELAETYRKLGEEGTELTERDKDLLEEQTEHMEDVIEETQEQLYSSWEEAIQAICDLYTTMIGRAIEDAGDKLAGELGSLDELADRFAKAQEIDNLYVADYERIYELSKLNRDILKSIDETDNVKAKQALADLQAEINQMDEDNVKLSEYQIENARRRYELTLAQLQLEEAKGAKSNVQMSRSATGEWSYVYTADETAVEEAEQNYEDKLYAMQKANAEYINELQQNIIDLQQRMMEEIQALRVEDFASAEEYYQAVQAIKDHYSQLMDYNVEQLGIVFDEQQRLYNDDWATYSQMTGYKISADEDYVDSWQETALAQQTGFDTMEQFHQNFNDTTDELFEDCLDAYETWEDNVEQAMEAVGTSTDEFGAKMEEDIGRMTEEAEQLAESVQQMGEDIQEAFLEMTEALSNWQAEYSAVIEDMLKKNEALAQSFNNLLKEWSGYNETVGQDPETPGEGEEEPGEEPPAEETPTGETPEEPGSTGPTDKDNKMVALAVWEMPGGAGWGTGGDRKRNMTNAGLDYDIVQGHINRMSGKSFKDKAEYAGVDNPGSYGGSNWREKRKKLLRPYNKGQIKFDTGGYTGEWGDGDGRLAVLHSKEIVLNKDDTTNFLAGIEILRDIVRLIDLNAVASAGYLSNAGTVGAMASTGDTLEQEVHITAEFPNATDKDEIKAAFEDLINLASQYANRK